MLKRQTPMFMGILLIMILSFGCDRSLDIEIPEMGSPPSESELEDDPNNVLINGHVELGTDQPVSWHTYVIGYNDYEISWTTEDYNSPSHSIKIQLDTLRHSNSFAYWQQPITFDSPIQNEFTLTAHIKLENIVGDGVAISMRCDDDLRPSGAAEAFYSTQGRVLITGSKNWAKYTVKATDVPSNIRCISVFLLLLGQTTGTVYFDDITLTRDKIIEKIY